MRNRSVSHTCYSDSASMICESQTIVVDYVLMSISHEKVSDLNEGDGRGEEWVTSRTETWRRGTGGWRGCGGSQVNRKSFWLQYSPSVRLTNKSQHHVTNTGQRQSRITTIRCHVNNRIRRNNNSPEMKVKEKRRRASPPSSNCSRKCTVDSARADAADTASTSSGRRLIEAS